MPKHEPDRPQPRDAFWAAGLPRMTAVITGAPTVDGGLLCILALIPEPDVPDGEIAGFVRRFGFVPRQETARAADSRVQWGIKHSGAISLAFLADDGMSQMELPPKPGVLQWSRLARQQGGTISVMLLPRMRSFELSAVAARLGSQDGPYWHLSAGFTSA